MEKTELFLEQSFDYYSSPMSNSGFYLFDPMEPAKEFESLKISAIYEYNGELYRCLHVIIKR